jgi:hypothetical protein
VPQLERCGRLNKMGAASCSTGGSNIPPTSQTPLLLCWQRPFQRQASNVELNNLIPNAPKCRLFTVLLHTRILTAHALRRGAPSLGRLATATAQTIPHTLMRTSTATPANLAGTTSPVLAETASAAGLQCRTRCCCRGRLAAAPCAPSLPVTG